MNARGSPHDCEHGCCPPPPVRDLDDLRGIVIDALVFGASRVRVGDRIVDVRWEDIDMDRELSE